MADEDLVIVRTYPTSVEAELALSALEAAGIQPAAVFHVESARLLPAASRVVDCCLLATGNRSVHTAREPG